MFADKISPLLCNPSNFDMISLNLRGSLLMRASFSSAPKPRPRIDYFRSDFRTNVECKAFIRCAHLQSCDEDLDNLFAIFFGLQVAPNSCASRTANHVVFLRRPPHLSASCLCYFSVQQNHPKLFAKNSSRSSQNYKAYKSELTHHQHLNPSSPSSPHIPINPPTQPKSLHEKNTENPDPHKRTIAFLPVCQCLRLHRHQDSFIIEDEKAVGSSVRKHVQIILLHSDRLRKSYRTAPNP